MRQALIRGILTATLACAGTALASLPATALADTPKKGAAQSAKYKVVLQVSENDPKTWNLALNNAKNVQADLGKENVDIEIVAYGPGLAMLKAESIVANRLSDVQKAQIGLVACENTMHNTKTSKEDMHAGINFTQAGVTHIMKWQREGWAYIRP